MANTPRTRLSRYRVATWVGAATLLVAGPAWAQPRAVAAAPSNSDLEVVRIDPDPMAPGGRTDLHAFVANLGPETTNSSLFITVTLPPQVKVERPFFPDTCEPYADDHRVRCEFGAGLRKDRSATALIPLRIDYAAELGTYKGTFTVRSADDRNARNNRTEFEIRVIDQVPDH
ncbi:hypothetical protein [Streptomyces antimicrobicus]|uniref:DUF11 domain-containing protein n=1 Tax=Streptomyces antimicrobicus TaxID=2883108 RepID=A0ABS8AZZ9_9ACTN|nr:hypothetical protein [Streptomyces antimicrobicus]MCB5177927.1 hypothetical protein [Streptomyces antimicrobicus]